MYWALRKSHILIIYSSVIRAQIPHYCMVLLHCRNAFRDVDRVCNNCSSTYWLAIWPFTQFCIFLQPAALHAIKPFNRRLWRFPLHISTISLGPPLSNEVNHCGAHFWLVLFERSHRPLINLNSDLDRP